MFETKPAIEESSTKTAARALARSTPAIALGLAFVLGSPLVIAPLLPLFLLGAIWAVSA